MGGGADPHGRRKVTQEYCIGRERELEKAGQRQRRSAGKKKGWTDCVAEDHRLFGIMGD